jgi:hypothetical protein
LIVCHDFWGFGVYVSVMLLRGLDMVLVALLLSNYGYKMAGIALADFFPVWIPTVFGEVYHMFGNAYQLYGEAYLQDGRKYCLLGEAY